MMTRLNGRCVVALAGLAVSATAHAQFAFSNAIPGTFLDISGTGSLVATGDDVSGSVTVSAAAANAAFPAGTMGACTNGHAGYGVDTQYTNFALPSTGFYGGATAAAVYFDDLITGAGPNAGVYSQELTINNVTVLIIQWNNMDHFASSPSTGTFQLKIYGGGTGSSGTGPNGCFAQFIYQDVDFGDANSNGASATIGFQVSGSAGIQYSFNTTGNVTSGTTLSLTPDVQGACCRTDGTCSVTFLSTCTGGGAIFQGAGTQCGNCPVAGACCLTDGSCSNSFLATCTSAGGVFHTGTNCGSFTCPMPQGVWIEQGDSGDFFETCNITRGTGALNAIRGGLGVDDADMYAIRICDPANFSAQTVGGATFDSQLFLFTAAGMGVESDDDDPYGSGTLQSHITSLYTSSLPAGVYFLAVSAYDKDPVDSGAQAIWQDQPFNVERAPDGPGAANPMASWDTGSFYQNVTYTIALTGACYAQASAPSCYANCDSSTTIPCLNVLDFTCFLNSFAAGASYANCDASTTIPVLNVLDFTCFLNRFAAGCSSC